MLVDQGMENWLKAHLGLTPTFKMQFPKLIDLAAQRGLLNRKEAYRVRRFHSTRNRVQYRGGHVQARTVRSMLGFYIQL